MELMPMPPIISLISWRQRIHQIDQAAAALFRVEALHQIGLLSGDAPVAFPAVTGAAEVAAQCQQRGGGDIAGIGAQSHGLYYVGCGADGTSGDERYVIPDAFVPESLIDCGQSQFQRNAHIVPDAGRRRSRSAPEAVDGDDVCAASARFRWQPLRCCERRRL